MKFCCFILCYVLAAGNFASTNGLKRGVKAAVTQEMLDRAKDVAVPMLVSYLASLPIPDQKVGSIKLKNIKLHVENEPGSKLELQAPNKAFVALTDFKISADLKVELSFIHCGATAHTKGADLSLILGATANDAGTLTFTVQSVSVDLGDFGLKMHNLGCDVINTVVGWFVNEKSKIQDAIKDQLDGVADQLNSLIGQWSYQVTTAEMGLQAPLDKATLDLHFADVEVAKELDTGKGYLQLGATGEVRDAATPTKVTPVVAPPLPDMTRDQLLGHGVTAEISNYTLDSAFYTYFEQGSVMYYLDAATLDDSTRDTLSTSSPVWKVLEYEWDEVFDESKNVSMKISASSQPVVQIVESGITFDADIDFEFIADNSSAGEPVNPVTLVVFSCPLHARGDVTVNATSGPIAIVPYLHNDTNCTMFNKSSPIQPIGPSPLLFLNEILIPQWLPSLVDQLDGLLEGGIEIPSVEADTPQGLLHVAFENASLKLSDGIATAGIDVKGELRAGEKKGRGGISQMAKLAKEIRQKIFHQVRAAFSAKLAALLV